MLTYVSSSSDHPNSSTEVHLDSSLTQTIIPTTLLSRFPFFSTKPRCQSTFVRIRNCLSTSYQIFVLKPFKASIICQIFWIWSSSVLLSISYSNYFDSLKGSIITDSNNTIQTLRQFFVVLISPFAPCILPLISSYNSFFKCQLDEQR